MNNEKGSILVVTVTFVLIFTLMGLGSMHLAGLQNQLAERQKSSVEAFWIADGAVERAVSRLPAYLFSSNDSVNYNVSLGKGMYDLSSDNAKIYDSDGNVTYTYQYKWIVTGRGTVGNQTRTIQATIDALDIRSVIATTGDIKDFENCPQSSTFYDCTLAKPNSVFSLDTFFDGYNTNDIKDLAANTYVDPSNSGDVNPISGITVVELENKNSLNITTDNIPSGETVFLIVDTTGVESGSKNPPQINISGNPDFEGIIWIRGEAELKGTSSINGTVFVEGEAGNSTKLAGNLTLHFDPEEIEKAVSLLGYTNLFPPGELKYTDWEEI